MQYVIEPERAEKAQKRIDEAADEAFSLALDCIFDMALQQALVRRNRRECDNGC